MSRKSGKNASRPAWINGELLEKLKNKKEVYGMWKQEPVTWEEYKDTLQACRDTVRKAKPHLELNLARIIKGNRKGLYKYIGNKKNTRDNMGMLLKRVESW